MELLDKITRKYVSFTSYGIVPFNEHTYNDLLIPWKVIQWGFVGETDE